MKFSLRQLLKSPGFTLVAVLTLALGIGVNTAMFSLLNTLLFHEPPYPESERILRVFRHNPTLDFGPHAPGNFLDLQAQARSFTAVAAVSGTNYSLAEPSQPAARVPGLDVSAEFFAVLGIPAALGRVFTVEEDQPGRDGVIVLSDGLWRDRFNADPAIIGRRIRVDGEPVTVIGVMPPAFEDRLIWGRASAWRPIAFTTELRKNRGANWLTVIARLRPAVTIGQAQAELDALGAELARAYPQTNAKSGFTLVPLARSVQDPTARTLSWFAMGLAGCVLLIACANLANLQFARHAARAREQAIRAALGASRFRLVRQSLAESLLLAMLGGAAALLVALWCNDALSARLGIAGQTGYAISIDWRVAAFALGITAFTGIAFGTMPALFASRVDVNDALKQGGRGSTSSGQHRLRHALIVAEVALALVLLSGAGFFVRGLQRFAARDHGWRTDRLLTASLSLPPAKYRDDAATAAFYERLQPRLAALPGVQSVSLSRTVPFDGFGFSQRFLVEGRPEPTPGLEPMRDVNGVSPEYFDTLGLTLIEGRTFTPADLTGPVRTVINETMARQLWPGESAIGKHIAHPFERVWQEVIGVVRDVRFATNLTNPRTPFQTYRLLAREPARDISVAIRSSVSPEILAASVRGAVAEVDADVPVENLRSAEDVIETGLGNYTLTSELLLGFALLGLLLAAVGIYGVIAQFVVQRTNEIGIRIALGAQLRDVFRLVVSQGLRLALIGIAIGLAGAWMVARLLASFAPALPPAEALTALAVIVALLGIALIACLLPARRATKVDPMTALRAE